jgi:GTP-binding protein
MKITSAEFFKSVFIISEIPKLSFPEYVFAGRSNVGKSTLINILCNKKKLAKTSSTPGKTQSINYFLINENIFFVDLPGYGFAKTSGSNKKIWKNLIESYLNNNKNIKMMLILVDIRRGLLDSDWQMLEWIEYHHLPFSIILTKSDKVSKNDIISMKHGIQQALKNYSNLNYILPFSNKAKDGSILILDVF